MFENFKKITIKGGCFENETELELFKKDAVTVVYGRNGSGKTTIANAMKAYVKDKTGETTESSVKELEVKTDADIPAENCSGVYVFDEEFVGSQVRVKKDGISTIVMLGEQVELDELIADKKEKLSKLEKDRNNLKFDSEEAFKKMAYDHYGELGLSRNDVHATGYYTPGKWLITFGVSYSAWVDAGCEIALALYEAGAPLLVHDAQKMLDILEERDFVMLTPHTFHDYLNHHEEGSAFSLPYECYWGNGDEITREQYDECRDIWWMQSRRVYGKDTNDTGGGRAL